MAALLSTVCRRRRLSRCRDCSLKCAVLISSVIVSRGTAHAIECVDYQKQIESVAEQVAGASPAGLQQALQKLCDNPEARACDDGYLAQDLVDSLASAVNKGRLELEWFMVLQFSRPACFKKLLLRLNSDLLNEKARARFAVLLTDNCDTSCSLGCDVLAKDR
jgi:hypothetical protein